MATALLSCMLAAAIRMTAYVSVTNIWWIYPFEVTHGWSFAIMYTAAALLGEEYASEGLQATVVGAANSAQQMGALIATLVWAVLIEATSMHVAFLAAAVLFALASLPLLLSLPAAGRFLCQLRSARPLAQVSHHHPTVSRASHHRRISLARSAGLTVVFRERGLPLAPSHTTQMCHFAGEAWRPQAPCQRGDQDAPTNQQL